MQRKEDRDMNIRESLEQWESEYLSPFATLSVNSKGRAVPEPQCDIRPVFQRDRDRIIHSKSFRRLKDKTQVFLSPDGDHYRTRMTHTLEVSQTARTIAKALRLNEELTEAIALGHDLGHTPFGHAGERALSRVCPLGFKHNEQSIRTVDILEKDGQGINLTFEVRDGILNHQMSCMPSTLEGKIVRLSDKIAYIHHDMDDAIRAGIITEEDVPRSISGVIGSSCNDRMDTFIHDIVNYSENKNDIAMSPEVDEAMKKMREFMFERIYENKTAKSQEGKAENLIETLYGYYSANMDQLPDFLLELRSRGEKDERLVCDYIAGMTDRFAIARYQDLFIPTPWHG
jgi:dGTPase